MSVWNEETIKEQIFKITGRTFSVDSDTNLIEAGINSIQVMKLAGIFRKSGRKVTFADLMENQNIASWSKLLEGAENIQQKKLQPAAASSEVFGKPFDLTDVQYSYWIGRGAEQPMGDIDCHAYYEFDGENINAERLKKAWNTLFEYHPMLRVRVTDDGKQVIMPSAYKDSFHLKDLRGTEDYEEKLLDIRNNVSHRKLDIENGETAGLILCVLDNGKNRIIIDVALLVCDVQSIKILFRDLADIYAGNILVPDTDKNWSFSLYLNNISNERIEEEKEAESYWKKRVKNMPLGPILPLAERPENIGKPLYTHHTHILSAEKWLSIKEKSANAGVTSAMFLLTAYSKLISRWSTNKKFLINVPLFDRSEEFPKINNVIADFTTLFLSEQDYSVERSFSDDLEFVSSNFIRDMRYAAYNGVKIQRDLQKKYPGQRDFAPVVFACNIGMDFISDIFEKNIGKIYYMVSQTPQVWIDCQIFERGGELHISWDTADKLFPEGMTNEMFGTFISYLEKLALPYISLDEIIEPDLSEFAVRKTVEDLYAEMSEKRYTLTDALLKNCKENPDAPALYECGENISITYGELYRKSISVAAELLRNGFSQGDRAAVIMPRGYRQITAIYGILLAGGCYVPVSYNQPSERLNKIFDSLELKFAVTDGNIPEIKCSENIRWIQYNDGYNADGFQPLTVSPADSAYIIMTSGSTGEPKGVEIAHESAMNTINDVNLRNCIKQGARFIGVSAIDFDLSVYDIFGSAAVGGVLYVMPDNLAKDAEFWLNTIAAENITVWNSVPILFDMLITAAEQKSDSKLKLENVMLSGDWISADLVKRARKLLGSCRIVGMGGATEASIWSNECVVPDDIPPEWINVPYGRALTAQMYRIVDSLGNDCPDWAEGELLIGGIGTAKGYFNSPQLTSEKFFEQNGVTWYRTGDMGRFWSDGTIEFLGRKDCQVKIKGHRIELGEIESAVRSIENILMAAALVQESGSDKHIAVCYTTLGNIEIDKNTVTDSLKKQLPDYMLPEILLKLEEIPVNANGKIDRKAVVLPDISINTIAEDENFTETEAKLRKIWEDNLETEHIGKNDDYFERGGNSLKATKMIYDINHVFNVKVKIGMIFKMPSLEDMAAHIDELIKAD